MARQMIKAMEKMTKAVESVDGDRRQSQYHKGIEEAMDVVAELRRPGGPLPDWERWRRVRAVVSGALPMPSASEQQPHGRDE